MHIAAQNAPPPLCPLSSELSSLQGHGGNGVFEAAFEARLIHKTGPERGCMNVFPVQDGHTTGRGHCY